MQDNPHDTFTNHLAGSTSPYLLQHVHNPVDWFPWGDEAFDKARKENKPIFLSIGYSSCHWCHVMAHESFEDEGIAEILNRHFVSIKVDREERPDVDSIYMTAVQMMTGQGGWPLTVFLTPGREPFYGGTYFPPEDRWGRPGFSNLLLRIVELWHGDHARLMESAQRMTDALERQAVSSTGSTTNQVNQTLVDRAVAGLRDNFDAAWGGFSEAPKFPSSAALMLLLKEHERTGDAQLLQMVERTLDKMAYGGMYDQVGGGFHRYSTDAQWLVPHFEKMLYDNAQLAPVYLRAYQVTGNEEYRRIAAETLDYVIRDMTSPEGAFYSAQDADTSEGEGIYYVWPYDQFVELAGPDTAELMVRYFGVTRKGNFEHQNILHLPVPPERFAEQEGLGPKELRGVVDQLRERLLAIRSEREAPGTDTKILAGWNGLMIGAFVDAYEALDDERYLNAALRAGNYVREHMWVDGQLMRVSSAGAVKIPAYLDDYALTVNAFTRLAEATGDLQWLVAADQLAADMLQRFGGENGILYYTDGTDPHVIVREQSVFDGVIPAGNSAAATALLRLSGWTGNQDHAQRARQLIKQAVPTLARSPRGLLNMLGDAAWYALYPPAEIVIVEGCDGDSEQMLKRARAKVGNIRVLRFDPDQQQGALKRFSYLADRKAVDGRTTAYVCLDFRCLSPVSDPDELASRLSEFGR